MDNRRVQIQSEGRAAFDLAMQLAFIGCVRLPQSAKSYSADPQKGLVLYFDSGAVELPCALDWKAAADLAWAWLQSRSDADLRDWCDHDGSNGRGWRVHLEGRSVAVQAVWAWYGK